MCVQSMLIGKNTQANTATFNLAAGAVADLFGPDADRVFLSANLLTWAAALTTGGVEIFADDGGVERTLHVLTHQIPSLDHSLEQIGTVMLMKMRVRNRSAQAVTGNVTVMRLIKGLGEI